MPNKINIRDYDFTPTDAAAYVAFMIWIQAHPQGGLFAYKEHKLMVTQHQTLFTQLQAAK